MAFANYFYYITGWMNLNIGCYIIVKLTLVSRLRESPQIDELQNKISCNFILQGKISLCQFLWSVFWNSYAPQDRLSIALSFSFRNSGGFSASPISCSIFAAMFCKYQSINQFTESWPKSWHALEMYRARIRPVCSCEHKQPVKFPFIFTVWTVNTWTGRIQAHSWIRPVPCERSLSYWFGEFLLLLTQSQNYSSNSRNISKHQTYLDKRSLDGIKFYFLTFCGENLYYQ